MILEIDSTAEVPIYQQLYDQIVLGIAKGQLQPGEQLPSVRQLAGELGINAMTISKAYNFLKEQGYLVTDRRKGTMVTLPPPYQATDLAPYQQQLSLILAEARLHQRSPEEIMADVQQQLAEFKND